MKCRYCHNELERPGDYCQVCDNSNTDVLGVYFGEKIRIYIFYEEKLIGEEVINPIETKESDKVSNISERNNSELISEIVHRKRPEMVLVSGIDPLKVLKLWETNFKYTDSFNNPDKFVKSVKNYLNEENLGETDLDPNQKVGGKHSTVIGDKKGNKVLKEIARSPFVKKIIPGPISGSHSSSKQGFSAKIGRSDTNGNLKVLFKKGATVQDLRVVTTAHDRDSGNKVSKDLSNRVSS